MRSFYGTVLIRKWDLSAEIRRDPAYWSVDFDYCVAEDLCVLELGLGLQNCLEVVRIGRWNCSAEKLIVSAYWGVDLDC